MTTLPAGINGLAVDLLQPLTDTLGPIYESFNLCVNLCVS